MSLTKKPTNQAFSEVFDKVASEYERICNAYSLVRRREFVQAHARGKILEVGAASGVICEPLRNTHDVTVCDISPEMCRMAEKRGLKAICCDAENLPFDNGDFNTVVATEVLYYFDHPDRFIGEAARVLAPGGSLLLTLPSATGRMADRARHILRKLGFSGMYFDDGIRRFIPIKKVCRLLSDSAFGEIRRGQMIVFPKKQFDQVNRLLESSPFKHLSLFATVIANKD